MQPSGETSEDEQSSGAPPTVIVKDVSDIVVSRFSEPRRTMREEDELLRHTSAGFADWVTTFIRRVLLLMENLPDEKVVDRSAKPTSDSDGELCA
jgi:proteasome activator subunit 4